MTETDNPTPKRRNAQNFTQHEEVGGWYDAKYTEMGGGWHTPPEELDAHLDALGLPEEADGRSIIDLGFGDGQLLVRAVRRGASCYGVDLSHVGRQMARKRYVDTLEALVSEDALSRGVGWRTFVLRNAAMEETFFEDNAFDFAISLGSMEHALDIPAAVTEMARILKPHGRFLLYVPNEEWIHEDQPLETTAPSSWWVKLCRGAGLWVNVDEKIRDNNRITGWKTCAWQER